MNDKDSCAAKVKQAAQSRLDTIRVLMGEFTADDIEIRDDGTLDTVVAVDDIEERYCQEFMADCRAATGAIDLEALCRDIVADFSEPLNERFHEYGLAFDYVEPNTFEGQSEAYFRYQISCGGPSEEIRFYTNPDFSMYRSEFWYLDWFDGAHVDATKDNTVASLWNYFQECESPRHAFEEASQ